jgi:hypothetical protein
MIRWELQAVLFGVAFIIMILIGIVFYDLLIPFAISPLHFFGSIILTVFGLTLLSIQIIKGKSPPFVCEQFHSTVNDREMFPFDWNSPLLKDEPVRMMCIPTGGIDACGIHPKSTSDDPICTGPAKYLKRVGRAVIFDVNFNKKEANEYPLDMRKRLIRKYRHRWLKAPKYHGYTGRFDSSITHKNLKIEFDYSEDNKIANCLGDNIDTLLEVFEKKKEKLSPNILYKKIGETDDPN